MSPKEWLISISRGKTFLLFVGVLTLLCLRLTLIWRCQDIPPYYYVDSASHILFGFLNYKGLSDFLLGPCALPSCLYAVGAGFGWDLFYAPFIVNGFLAVSGIAFLFFGTRRLAGDGAALTTAALVVSIPAFSRLVFSGNLEMTAIALSCAAYWCACQGRAGEPDRGFIWTMGALGVLGAALWARPESAGLLLLAAAGAAYVWRGSPRRASVIIASALFLLGLRFPNLAARLWATQANNEEVRRSAGTLLQRMTMLPASLMGDGVITAVLSFGFGSIAGAASPPLASLVFCLMALQALALWGASVFFAASCGEMERNLCLIQVGLSVPAGILISKAWSWKRRVLSITAGVSLALALAASWRKAVPQGPVIPASIEQNRRLGWGLRQLAQKGVLGPADRAILLVVENRDWPNAVVFSGLQERLRLFPRDDIEWGTPLAWDGRSSVGFVIVRSGMVPRGLGRTVRLGGRLAQLEGYSIHPAEVLGPSS